MMGLTQDKPWLTAESTRATGWLRGTWPRWSFQAKCQLLIMAHEDGCDPAPDDHPHFISSHFPAQPLPFPSASLPELLPVP